MKKYIVAVLLTTSFAIAYATVPMLQDNAPVDQKAACVDLQYGLKLRSKDANTKMEVSLLQRFLKDEGFLITDPDGYFGSTTQKALKNFQSRNGLFASGVTWSSTRKVVKQLSCNRQAKSAPALPAAIKQVTSTSVTASSGPVSILESYVPTVSPATEKQNINSLSGVSSGPVATSSVFLDEAGFGVYKGFLNGSLFIRTENITKKDAYDNCQLNHSTNPMKSISCTWNEKEIYSSVKISSGVTVQGIPFTVTKESNSGNDQIKNDKVTVLQEQQVGSVVVAGKEIQPPLIIMGTKNTRIGTYRFTIGAKEDVVFSDLKVTVRNLATFDFSKRATSLVNMTFTVLGKTYPAIKVSEGVYSIYTIHFDNAPILKKNTTVDAVLAADIGSGEGGSVDLWSNRDDFVFKGVNSSGVIIPTSTNSAGSNNFYWSGYLNVGKAMSSERLPMPSVLGASMACVALNENLHRGNETTETVKLQDFLKSLGYLDDSTTGFYGDDTIVAVKKYQRSKGLPETGMVYDFTRSVIKDDTCGGI